MEETRDPNDAQLKNALKALTKAVGELGKAVSSEVNQHKPEMVKGLADGLRQAAEKLDVFSGAASEARGGASERAQQTRTQLLEAAAQVFAAKGFERASMDDVAKAAGFTKGALYAHFSSKYELIVALTEEVTQASQPLPGFGQLPGLLSEVSSSAACDDLSLTIEIFSLALRDEAFRERIMPSLAKTREEVARQVAANRGAALDDNGLPQVTPEDREAALGLTGLVAAARIAAQLDPSQEAGPVAGRLVARLLATAGDGGAVVGED